MLCNQIHDARVNINLVTKEMITDICNQISNIFMESDSLIYQDRYNLTENSCNENKNNKRWFGYQCQSARRKYHLAKKIHSKYPTQLTRSNLNQDSKCYKSNMNFYINKHNRETQRNLRNLQSKNPKEYWKILNSLNTKPESTDINLDFLYTFFKELNEENTNDNNLSAEEINKHIDQEGDEILNFFISETEIMKCIKSLKNNKSCSYDKIINEYIKNTSDVMMVLYVKFFNIVFDTEFLPDSWLEGVIKPIFKRKGDPLKPENYRPITILSCFGKLFTSDLNSRLENFLEKNEIINENQEEFRAGYSTTDHNFVLHSLIELLKTKKMKLFLHFRRFQ